MQTFKISPTTFSISNKSYHINHRTSTSWEKNNLLRHCAWCPFHFNAQHRSRDRSSLFKLPLQKDGSRKDVKCPTIVTNYNNFRRGVDHADRLRQPYCVDRRSKKIVAPFVFWNFGNSVCK
jgi:hypothetical protein